MITIYQALKQGLRLNYPVKRQSMENYKIEIMPSADQGLIDIAEYIALDNPKKAKSFVLELIKKTAQTLSIFPFGGKVYTEINGDEIRSYPYKNYISLYRVIEEKRLVEILYIFNSKREFSRYLKSF